MNHPSVIAGESLVDAMCRLLLHYNSSAALHLERKTRLQHHIHEARLCCKRARAILRLGKEGIESASYTYFNGFFRDRSAQLAPMRDLTAMIETVELLLEKKELHSHSSLLAEGKKLLTKQRIELVQDESFSQTKLQVRDAFAQNNHDILRISCNGEIGAVFGKGIQRMYGKGKGWYRSASSDPDNAAIDEWMHEWRKQVKYLWYQLIIICPLWPEMIQPFARQLQLLSKLLGEYNDLTVMKQTLDTLSFTRTTRRELKKFENYCFRKKTEIKRQSLDSGSRIYLFSTQHIAKNIDQLFSNLHQS